ncbi:hypothetical protein PS1_030489 [Malus domestica]
MHSSVWFSFPETRLSEESSSPVHHQSPVRAAITTSLATSARHHLATTLMSHSLSTTLPISLTSFSRYCACCTKTARRPPSPFFTTNYAVTKPSPLISPPRRVLPSPNPTSANCLHAF